MAIGKHMAATNGYTPMQSSSLYVTDGDEIDWAYGTQRIWMYTFELYPSHSKVSGNARFYPAGRADRRGRPTRNKAAILYLIDHAGCLYAVIGLTQANCGPFFDDFEIARGWTVEPARDGHRDVRGLAARDPAGDGAADRHGDLRRRASSPRGRRPARASMRTTSTASPASARR